ncbi:MAG: DUF3108 domain-containing protein [candidate division KSB1 bacterium]|nr:DUF3108 domain-containing protein [candidate division KSB1 bacterium]MDZ7301761.1 DUF3108 domain-containing protein [candidate division KSB1 bacterium]MDZ7311460.1 DUF3108 domain-containing protein [candidate division KSB1 bacterium]
MKEISAFLILGWGTISALHAQFNPANLVPETLRYRMGSGSTDVGSSTITISRDHAAGIIHIIESYSGLFEQTAAISLRNDSTLQMLNSHAVITRDNQYHEARLKYHNNGRQITGAVRWPAAFGGTRVIDVELPYSATDIYAVPHLFRATPLALNKTIRFHFFNVLQNEKGLARGWVSRLETVTVPAGSFECFRVEAYAGKTRLILNIDTQFPHRVIRQILPSLEIKFELAAVDKSDLLNEMSARH